MKNVILYSAEVTERLTYIAQLIFEQLLGCEVELTTSLDVYTASKAAQINYSTHLEIPGYPIQPSSLLFEDNIRHVAIEQGTSWMSVPTLYLDTSSHFDALAASFYLVSRYEEYLPFKKDDHNRFTASQSCLQQLGLLQLPLVNKWAVNLQRELMALYPNFKPNPRTFEYLSTIDIDQAWKYKNKGFIRNCGGLLRDVIQNKWAEVRARISVLTNNQPDVFFNFDWQDRVHEEFDVKAHYFMQVGGRSKFDKNTDLTNAEFQQLIKRLDQKYNVGIHPSYKSNHRHALVAQERQALEHIVAHDITSSRQHFLMHEMPETYQRLYNIGVKQDHTMGYSTHLGFRAGIAAPFYFFDLSKNESTNLELVPFCCMDITPLYYMEQSPSQAVTTVTDLMDEVKKVGGLFVSLWHNESMSEDGRWHGWRTVYYQMLNHAHKLTAKHEREA